MRLRHHRKRMQRAMANLVVRRRRGRAMLVSSARRCGKTFAAQRWFDERENPPKVRT